jgi:hypothetical protein
LKVDVKEDVVATLCSAPMSSVEKIYQPAAGVFMNKTAAQRLQNNARSGSDRERKIVVARAL